MYRLTVVLLPNQRSSLVLLSEEYEQVPENLGDVHIEHQRGQDVLLRILTPRNDHKAKVPHEVHTSKDNQCNTEPYLNLLTFKLEESHEDHEADQAELDDDRNAHAFSNCAMEHYTVLAHVDDDVKGSANDGKSHDCLQYCLHLHSGSEASKEHSFT